MIDYSKIANSIIFYEKYGFKRIEAPWMVSEEISNITCPPTIINYTIKETNKVLVASGEQSFLYLANKSQLIKGLYQTTTPCFRSEPVDLLHRKNFIKNELINCKNVNNKELKKMINNSLKFFEQFIDKTLLKVIETPSHASLINYDIVALIKDQELELGSYGIRKCDFLEWIYGTGCAEPRLSLIMNRINLEKGN